jgi:hypothetical protein
VLRAAVAAATVSGTSMTADATVRSRAKRSRRRLEPEDGGERACNCEDRSEIESDRQCVAIRVREIRDDIDRHIDELLDELNQQAAERGA